MSCCFFNKLFCGTFSFFALLRRSNREGAKSTKDTRRNRAPDDLVATSRLHLPM